MSIIKQVPGFTITMVNNTKYQVSVHDDKYGGITVRDLPECYRFIDWYQKTPKHFTDDIEA